MSEVEWRQKGNHYETVTHINPHYHDYQRVHPGVCLSDGQFLEGGKYENTINIYWMCSHDCCGGGAALPA